MYSLVMDIAIKTRYTGAAYCKNLMLMDSLFFKLESTNIQ